MSPVGTSAEIASVDARAHTHRGVKTQSTAPRTPSQALGKAVGEANVCAASADGAHGTRRLLRPAVIPSQSTARAVPTHRARDIAPMRSAAARSQVATRARNWAELFRLASRTRSRATVVTATLRRNCRRRDRSDVRRAVWALGG